MDAVVISKDNWTLLLDKVEEKAGKKLPAYQCLANYYSVCIPSLITSFTTSMWEMWRVTDGLAHETYDSYMRVPAKIVDAMRTIRTEKDRIERVQREAASESEALTQIVNKGGLRGKRHG